MLRLIALIAALVFAAPAAHADAETVRNRFVSVLQEDGYREIRISRTLLGRMRFVGSRPDARREIVVNPNSGVVLRDYVRFLRNASNGSSNSSRDEDEDDDDDEDNYEDEDDYDYDYDDEDDSDSDDEDGGDSADEGDDSESDDESDNSGSGSSNSGSSNSGSGSDDDD